MKLKSAFWTALKSIIFFTILLGTVYPAIVTCIGQLLFYDSANGSLIIKDKKIMGSFLISQKFNGGKYFASRPSSIGYNPYPSGGSNLSATDSRLKENYESRKSVFIKGNRLDSKTEIPSEMLFASGSGVDPHISKESALLQLNRICNERNLNPGQKEKLIELIDSLSHKRVFGFFGEEYINVMKLNFKLDGMK